MRNGSAISSSHFLANLRMKGIIAKCQEQLSTPQQATIRAAMRKDTFGLMFNVSGVAVPRAAEGQEHNVLLNGGTDLSGKVVGTTLAASALGIQQAFVGGNAKGHMVDQVESPLMARFAAAQMTGSMQTISTYPLSGGEARMFDQQAALIASSHDARYIIPSESIDGVLTGYAGLFRGLYLEAFKAMGDAGLIKLSGMRLRKPPGSSVSVEVFCPTLEYRGGQLTWVGVQPDLRDLAISYVKERVLQGRYSLGNHNFDPAVVRSFHHFASGYRSIDISQAHEGVAAQHLMDNKGLECVVSVGDASSYSARVHQHSLKIGVEGVTESVGRNLSVLKQPATFLLAVDKDQENVYPGVGQNADFERQIQRFPTDRIIKAGVDDLTGPELTYVWHLWFMFTFIQETIAANKMTGSLQAKITKAFETGHLEDYLTEWTS